MEIVWLGHSCIRIRSGHITLVTDPYASSLGFPMPRQRADIVTISHDHLHHSFSEGITGNPRILTGPGEYEIGNFYISGVATPLIPDDPEERAINTLFLIRAEGLTLCHLGALSRDLSPGRIRDLTSTDVLFVSAAGGSNISTPRIAELVHLIGPRIVIPIHYGVPDLKIALDPVETFLTAMGATDVTPQPRLNISSTSLPSATRVHVLRRA